MATTTELGLLERLPHGLLDLLEGGEPAAFVTDSRERIVFWNAGAERMLGRRADEVLGQLCHDVLQGRDVFGNRYCQAACPVAGMARENAPIRSFELTVGHNGDGRQPLRVLPLRFAGPREDLFLLVHLLQGTDLSGAMAALRPFLPPCNGGAPLGAPELGPPPLSDREREVLRLAARGLQNKDIARRLGLSPATVRNHVHNTLEKLGVHSKLEAVALAYRRGWFSEGTGGPQ